MIATRRPAVPAPLYALGSIASVQVGATVARRLFPYLGPAGTVFVRVAFGALILLALARPTLRRLSVSQWREVVPFGLIIAGMNLCFYQSIARPTTGARSAGRVRSEEHTSELQSHLNLVCRL